MRAAGNKAMNTASTGRLNKGNFKHAGDLYDCQGCGAHCNMCRYKQASANELKHKNRQT
jgi:heterodisulfide reductase subunit A-like polyferredoxin